MRKISLETRETEFRIGTENRGQFRLSPDYSTIDNAQSIANIGVFNVTSGLQPVGRPTAVGPVGTVAGTGNWYQYFYTTTGGLMTWYVSGTANNNTPFRAYAREDIQCQGPS